MSQFFGRFALTAGATTYVQDLPTDGLSAIVVSNDSAFSVVASPEGAGTSLNIPAGVADVLAIPPKRGFTGTLALQASAQLTIQNSPANQVEINIYGYGEPVPSVYPLSLNRLSNTGNNVETQSTLIIRSYQNVNNSSFTPVPTAQQQFYLKGFTLTMDKAGAASSGVMTIGNMNVKSSGPANTLSYWIVQSGQLAILKEWFDSPIATTGQGIGPAFTIPNLTSSVGLIVYSYEF